ncbi:MAG: methylmalonyl Co-A mutase-associated GTPase MeaB [Deltaproteobacteria bacterium]|nr:methylmalonyl Co-A mutase-associated GTPase MeaB [Deltaproteobacteria bacterium]
MRPRTTTVLANKIIQGDVRAVARLIRRIDDGDPEVIPELRKLYLHAGRSHVIGFTGSPGVGKSTLVDRIVSRFRGDGKTVGIIAVDPTSPFSGGAILGDRIRMQRHFLDAGVFIRSMATRGSFGGLTRSTADAIVVLEAMGKDVVIVETVGVGQDEVDIAHSAHTTVLATVPGMGDDIQAIKAGLMEIGDLFVVNKADREGAAKTIRELRTMLEMSSERYAADGWMPPVLATQAANDEGIDELYQAILEHRRFLESGGGEKLWKRQQTRVYNQLVDLLKEHLLGRALQKIGDRPALAGIADRIVAGETDPYSACQELVERLLGEAKGDSQ